MTVTLQHESLDQGGFYVPRYEVKIEGANLPRDVLFDVRSLTYHDDVDGLDGFDLVVNNWDEARRAFKYIGSETTAQLARATPTGPGSRCSSRAARRSSSGSATATGSPRCSRARSPRCSRRTTTGPRS